MTLASQFMHQPTPAYKISKAALNMLTVQYALDLCKDGFTILAVNPGVSDTRK
jgi:NAD(P)-dependent dehydrogenase (short-subunit alcohol dehydrogenase family)